MVQMLIFTIIFTLTVIGAASAADNSSANLTATNIVQTTQSQHSSDTSNNITTSNNLLTNTSTSQSSNVQTADNLSNNKSTSSQTVADPQIWNGGVPVTRGIYPAGSDTGNIQNAINAAQSGDTIMLEDGKTFSGNGNTQITISKNLVFDVLNGGTATIDGGGTRWGFIISPSYTVTFNNIIFQNLRNSVSDNGGAIQNSGTLNLNNCIFSNNRADNDGGAIYNTGTMNIDNCAIYSNRVDLGDHGSGIYTSGANTVSITNSQIYNNNNVNGDGIGIFVNSGNPTISGNNIYGNYWQGIYVNSGNAVISNNNIYNNGHNTQHGDGIWINNGNAAITSNNIYSNFEDGIHVSGGNPGIHFNRIVGNGEYGVHMYEWGATISATNNWWGKNSAPTQGLQSGRDYCNERGTVTVNPWLVLGITANPYSITNGDTSTVTADLNHNWNGGSTYTDVSGLGHVMNGLSVNFSFTGSPLGTLSINPASTVNGAATTVFTANTVGTSHVNAALALDPATIVHTASNVAQTPCDIVITGSPVLTITKTANQANYNVGNNVVYTVHVTNTGSSAATNVVVTDTLPTGLTYVTSSNSGNYNAGTRVITWNLANLAANGQFNPTITSTVNAGTQGQTIPNTASTHCTQKPTDVTSQPVNIHVNNAVLTITKTADQANYNAGNSVVYTIHVTNTGPDPATNVVVTDTLPAGLTYVTSSNSGNYNAGTRVITWNLANLAANAQFNPTITSTVNAGTQGQTIANTASTHNDQNPTNVNSPNLNIHINNAILTITKTADQTNYDVGNSVLYTLDVLNNGPDASTNVVVTDGLPAGITYVSNTLGGIYNAGTRTITWNLANLASGAHFIPTFTATVNAATQGLNIFNTASAVNTQNPTPVTNTAGIHVNNAVLTITKTAAQANYNVGNNVDYTIAVGNYGPDTATNVVVTDTLPAGLTFVSSLGGSYNPVNRVITWNLGNLNQGVEFDSRIHCFS